MGEVSSTPRYVFVRHLAEGGMGQVELAVRSEGRFRRVYAVKRLREAYRDEPNVRRMFMEEARLAGMVRHANVVSVLDVGEDDRGPLLVMELVEGISLSRLLGMARKRGELLPVQLCLRVLRDVARGLHAAHDTRGPDGRPLCLVHRDVSPQNVLLGYDGVARISDFGIAKAMGAAGATSTGMIKGKAGYLSPEQLRFDEPDRRSDLFALGIVLYETLTCRRLYDGGLNEVAKRILTEPPPDVLDVRPDVHPLVVELLFELLSKDPEHRPATARDVVRRLDEVLVDLVAVEGVLALDEYFEERFAGERERQRRELEELRTGMLPDRIGADAVASEPRRRGLMLLVALAASAAIAAAVAASMSGGDPPPAADRPAPAEAARGVDPLPPPAATASAAPPDRPEAGSETAPAGATSDVDDRSTHAEAPGRERHAAMTNRTAPQGERPAKMAPAPDPTPDRSAATMEGLWGWDSR